MSEQRVAGAGGNVQNLQLLLTFEERRNDLFVNLLKTFFRLKPSKEQRDSDRNGEQQKEKQIRVFEEEKS